MKYDPLKVDNNFWNYSKVWKNTWNPVNKLTLSGESVIIIGQQDNQTWSDLLVGLRESGENPELLLLYLMSNAEDIISRQANTL